MRRPSPMGLRGQAMMAQRRNEEEENDKSTDYQTEPTIDRRNSGISRQSRPLEGQQQLDDSLQQQQQDQIQQQQQQQPQDNYPNFVERRLIHKLQSTFEHKNTILTCRYSKDDQNIAIGQQDGSLRIFNLKKEFPSYNLKDKEIPTACTAVRWCPEGNINNCLVASYANGNILYWHTTSQRILHRYVENENPINALDISIDGTKFASGGQDGKVRLYDLGKRSEPIIMDKSEAAPIHSNRVYGIKFDKKNPNLMVSGGWDNMILFWDLRSKQTTGFIYGPKIFSDSFDIHENQLLTGSWREQNQLELFDIRKLQKIKTLPWENYTYNKSQNSLVYCCNFSKTNPSSIIAGSTGTFELRIFDSNRNYECVDIYRDNLASGIYCLDTSASINQVAYGCGDGMFGLLNTK